MGEPALLTIAEAAERLRVSRRTVYRLIADRRLRMTKIRGSSFVTDAECDRFLRTAERNGGRHGTHREAASMTPILTFLAGFLCGAAAMAVVIFEWAAKPDCYEEEG